MLHGKQSTPGHLKKRNSVPKKPSTPKSPSNTTQSTQQSTIIADESQQINECTEQAIVSALHNRAALSICLRNLPADFSYASLLAMLPNLQPHACKLFYNYSRQPVIVRRVNLEFKSVNDKRTAMQALARNHTELHVEDLAATSTSPSISSVEELRAAFYLDRVSLSNLPPDVTVERDLAPLFPTASRITMVKFSERAPTAHKMASVEFASPTEAFRLVLQSHGKRVGAAQQKLPMFVSLLARRTEAGLDTQRVVFKFLNAGFTKNAQILRTLKHAKAECITRTYGHCIVRYATEAEAQHDMQLSLKLGMCKFAFHPPAGTFLTKHDKSVNQPAKKNDSKKSVAKEASAAISDSVNKRKRKLSASANMDDSKIEKETAIVTQQSPIKKAKNKSKGDIETSVVFAAKKSKLNEDESLSSSALSVLKTPTMKKTTPKKTSSLKKKVVLQKS